MLDIARGLEYLHLRKPAIIHRDVSVLCSVSSMVLMQAVQIDEYPHQPPGCGQSWGLWACSREAQHPIDDSQSCRNG